MCIIVAKPAGIRMPDRLILQNCFTNNPDGAGIMLASRGKVYGFKGFMNFEAFEQKLAKLEKKFGKLRDLNIVMHFRITTHGGSIAANTHPFPVSNSYKAMRQLEWVNDIGMAHNGIITCVSSHIDIKKENVSDTMVFCRRVVYPISRSADILSNKSIQEALRLSADSKLAFLDKNGKLAVLGDFIVDGGVYYSNSTYKEVRVWKSWKDYDWGDYGYYDKGGTWHYKEPKKDDQIFLSWADEKYLMETLAADYGLEILEPDDTIVYDDTFIEKVGKNHFAFDPSDQVIYEWISGDNEWVAFMGPDEYCGILEGSELA